MPAIPLKGEDSISHPCTLYQMVDHYTVIIKKQEKNNKNNDPHFDNWQRNLSSCLSNMLEHLCYMFNCIIYVMQHERATAVSM